MLTYKLTYEKYFCLALSRIALPVGKFQAKSEKSVLCYCMRVEELHVLWQTLDRGLVYLEESGGTREDKRKDSIVHASRWTKTRLLYCICRPLVTRQTRTEPGFGHFR